MAKSANARTVRRYFDACNSGILDDFVPTLARDVTYCLLPARFPPVHGAEHLARFWRKSKRVSNSVWAIDRIVDKDDCVVREWSLIRSLLRTSRRLMVLGTEWYVMRAGLIAEIRAYFAFQGHRDTEPTSFPYKDRRYLF